MRASMTAVCAVLLAAGLAGAGQRPGAGEKKMPEQAQKAQTAVKEHLAQFKGAESANVEWLGGPAVAAAFPNDQFFVVWFRTFPVARRIPEGLAATNLFVVPDKGKVKRLDAAEKKALREFFEKHVAPAKDEKSAKQATDAWLTLSTAYLRDGFFRFEVLGKETEAKKADGGLETSGRAMVIAGGKGQVTVALAFDGEGKLSRFKEDAKIQAGPRPICQATKLLDPDPIVRRMAEQDLLFMGLAAGDYLREQRAQANPELRQAIDRLWRRIQEQGW
jgi:hypothetical protein